MSDVDIMILGEECSPVFFFSGKENSGRFFPFPFFLENGQLFLKKTADYFFCKKRWPLFHNVAHLFFLFGEGTQLLVGRTANFPLKKKTAVVSNYYYYYFFLGSKTLGVFSLSFFLFFFWRRKRRPFFRTFFFFFFERKRRAFFPFLFFEMG